MIKCTVTSFDFLAHARDIQEAVERSTEAAARQLPERQRADILAGAAPDGSPQKRTPGDDLPLYSTGRLADASAWSVNPTETGWSVSPPHDRVAVVEKLKARGFRLMEPEHQVTPELDRLLDQEMAAIQSNPAKYTTKKSIG